MEKIDIEMLRDSLPKHPGILGREQYINSAIIIPLIKMNNSYHLLFQKRGVDISQGGDISFPGGKFDSSLDLTLKDTAIRETVEELGIKKEEIEVIGAIDTVVAHMGVIVEPFLALLNIKDLKKLNVNKREVEEVFTIPLDFFIQNNPESYSVRVEVQPSYIDSDGAVVQLLPSRELGLHPRYSSPWGGRKHKVSLYKTAKGPIWGITADIIKEVVKIWL